MVTAQCDQLGQKSNLGVKHTRLALVAEPVLTSRFGRMGLLLAIFVQLHNHSDGTDTKNTSRTGKYEEEQSPVLVGV
ncbi:hypothetical protein IWQ60_005003 [Tieghemiomyces parasiticus]|uniref:Uncharacterized protein n=1 Tax=Tieghemiomyces parasiticus TaxID=78921 RepID=A0A9W8DYU8_9FUNG|nr:hypothetical protein IWQ60_005003 [Tieghemiomyces parasiticus]